MNVKKKKKHSKEIVKSHKENVKILIEKCAKDKLDLGSGR